MHLFYFNDCIPAIENQVSFSEKLAITIEEFNELLKKDIGVQRGVVTHDLPAQCYYGAKYSLKEAIDNIQDKARRDLAYAFFTAFPVGKPHFDDSDETLITESYSYSLNDQKFDATNLAIVEKNNGFLFTVATGAALCIDRISVDVTNRDQALQIPNLFGYKPNTTFIEGAIQRNNRERLNVFDRLIKTLNARYTKQFKKEFNDLASVSQQLIIDHFEEAKGRTSVPTSYGADGDLIKEVTPSKSKFNVLELRVFKERALRIYFTESSRGVILASIGFKNNNQQDQDIIQAHKILSKFILTTY